MKKDLLLLVLYGVCAGLWLVSCVLELSHRGAADGLTVLSALVWGGGFILLLCRYRNKK